MIIASDRTTARAYARLLTTMTAEEPTVVLSDDPGSSARITEFAQGTSRWLVAVRMVSEGVDVPRLSVGVYATNASTPLFFAQAIGRFVRSRRPGETASIFVPSVPNLLQLASALEVQRNHVLGRPHRESAHDPLDGDPATRTQTERGGAERGFTALGADAELDQVIFDGSSFGTATPTGSDEEADYLGIPGLLDAEQMRALLHRRQDEQLRKRAQLQKGATQPATSGASASVHGQLRDLRRELHTLVSIATAAPAKLILEVRAMDRAGLLALLAGALEGAGAGIVWAKVNTFGSTAADVFCVTVPAELDARAAVEQHLLEVLGASVDVVVDEPVGD